MMMPYSSSLTDSEREVLEPLLVKLLPQKKRTKPSNWTKRDIINGIRDRLRNGAHLGRLAERPAALLYGLLVLAFNGEKQERSHN